MPTSRPTFTVAICTWNRARLLARTLETFTRLDIPTSASWELIVVNNRCTDDTDDVIASFEGRLPIRRVYEERPGLSAARNRVLSEFKGERLIFTDDDVETDRGWIRSLLETFEEWRADVVFGRSRPLWLSKQPAWFGPDFAGQFALLDYGPTAFVVTDPRHEFFGVNVAFTRAAALKLGAYNESMGVVGTGGGGGEDTEMFARARGYGMRVVYQAGAIVSHMIPPERTTRRRQRELAWRGGRANLQLLTGTFSGPSLLGVPRYLFRIAFVDLCKWAGFAIRRDASRAFFMQVRVIRFISLVREGIRARRNAVPNLERAPLSKV